MEEAFSACQNDLDCALDQYCDLMLQVCINLDAGTRRVADASSPKSDASDSGIPTPSPDTGMNTMPPEDAGTISPDAGMGFADAGAEQRVFVAKSGVDTADGLSPGTAVRTIGVGLEKSRDCLPDPCEVLISTGTYNEQLVLINGANIWGGFSLDFGRQDPTTWPVVLTSDEVRTVIGEDLNERTLIRGLTIRGADFSAESDGRSSYAVWLKNSSDVHFSDSMIEAGKGASGAAGSNGNVTTCNSVGGVGGVAYNCGSRSGSSGEASGDTSSSGGGGGGGSSNCPNACPLVGGDGVSSGTNGRNGGDGTDGAAGATTNDNVGLWVDGYWSGAIGERGERGQHGTGGGGGGSGGTKRFVACFGCSTLNGGRGGNGAAGGCAGEGGTAGLAGGGAFGIVLSGSNLELNDVTVSGGIGGSGGGGGAGHIGEPGGSDGSIGRESEARQRCGLINYNSGAGGFGGSGGTGGRGGGGSGGVGGPSIGVVSLDGSNLTLGTAVVFNSGQGGLGGSGGVGGNSAQDGMLGFTTEQATY